MAVLTRQGIQCYNHLMQPVEKEICTVDWEIGAAEKGGYEHFMFKEIMEQPEALRRAVFPRIRDGEVFLEDFSLPEDIILVASLLKMIYCQLKLRKERCFI